MNTPVDVAATVRAYYACAKCAEDNYDECCYRADKLVWHPVHKEFWCRDCMNDVDEPPPGDTLAEVMSDLAVGHIYEVAGAYSPPQPT